MNKVTTAALAGLMVVAAGAQASDSRWNGFGASSAYIADVQDMFTLPGVLASHADTTYFELVGTGTTDDWGGVNAKLGGGVLGLWFNRTSNTLGDIRAGYKAPANSSVNAGVIAAALAFENATNARLGNQLDVLYAFNLSDATTLGFGLSRGVNSTTAETVSGTTSNSDTNVSDLGLSLGLEQKAVGPISLLEVGLQYGMRNNAYTNKGTTTDKTTADGSRIALRVGGDMAGDGGMFSRVELGFSTSSLGLKTAFNTAATSTQFQESKNSAMTYNLGYAMGKSTEKGMGLMGLMLKSKSQSRDEANNGGGAFGVNKSDWSDLSLQASTAGEAKLNSWLTFRAGLESDIFVANTTVTETGFAGTTQKITTKKDARAAGSEAKASLGLTWTVGDVTIDGVASQDLLLKGPFLLSGAVVPLHTQVSATWPWGGSKN